MERLEDRNLLAGDLDLSPHVMAEGEGASCPSGLNYPLLAAYTGNLPENIARECFLQGTTSGAGGNSAVPQGEVPPAQQPIISVGESEPNDGLTTADSVPLGTGMGDNANVDVNATLSTAADVDFFRLDLDGGDVLHINLFGAAQTITVFDGDGVEMITSSTDANSLVPIIDTGEIRVPKGGNASLGVVIPTTGTYFLQVANVDITNVGGAYTAELRVQRPALESQPVGTHQRLFIDFNGAVIDTAIFGGTGVASLSPLSSFLSSWGLAATDEDALIDAIISKLDEDLGAEIRANGQNGDFLFSDIPGQFDIEILNSRDHRDPFGEPNVSRVIVGGTIGEFGIPTLGIAQSIDPGNLDTTESAVTLLDIMSGQINPGGGDDINVIPLATGATKIDLVAAAVGGVTAHEAGHFFGLWHTNNANNVDNLIDQGGNGVADEAGVGPDGIFGSPDDVNTSFLNADNYNPTEFFTGVEDTLNTLSWGLSTGKLPSSVSGVKFHDVNRNGVRDLTEPGLAGWTIFADLDGDGTVDLREPKITTGADGTYVLSVPPGQHSIREVLQPGWEQTFPSSGSHTVVVHPNESVTDINFGNVSLFGGISGTKFNDLDGDGVFDQGEPGVPGIVIYLDLDGDNRLDLGEPMSRTDSNGNYSITISETGNFTVRESLTPGWEQTFPNTNEREHSIRATPGESFPGLNFGNTSRLDYGDAPTAEQSGFASSYPTTIADNGAVHAILPGFQLGAAIDGDPDGAPNATATGDDVNTTADDEDGVTINAATIFPGSPAGEITVTVQTNGYSPGRINAWMDFNRDGDWDDAGEHIVADHRAGDGSHVLTFPVPADAASGETYLRVRYGFGRNMKPTGSDIAGEVEDHVARILSEKPIAVDDNFPDVLENSGATTLDVLLNDLQSLSPPLKVIAAGAATPGVTAAGGQVTVAANGSAVVYTPPSNFSGDDSFSYTIRDDAGNTDSADVKITVLPSLLAPVAIDDSETVQAGSTNNQLDVLANDLPSQNPPIGIVSVDTVTSKGGSVAIDNRGTEDTRDDTLVYTPAANFQGPDQFTYTVQDQNNATDTATVTVHVGDVDQKVRIRLQATDLNGNAIQQAAVGEEFNLQVRVADDLRADDEDGDGLDNRFGVAAAYLDILYDRGLVSLSSSRQPFFSAEFQNAISISTSTPGLIDEAGAFQSDQSNPLGRVCQIEVPGATCAPQDNEFVVLTIPMRATAQGIANFTGDPADRRTQGPLTPPDHDVLLFNPAAPVLLEQIRYENDSLRITGSGGLPVIVDNTFHLAANSNNNMLDVLANDTELSSPPLTITATGLVSGGPALQGSVSIASDGSKLLYTPGLNFVGTEQFTYTATNTDGRSADAVVTVQVGNSPNDINLRLETTDLSGNPISTIAAGSEFKVRAYVQDIRTSPPDAARTGVFAIYFDLLYDSGLTTTKNDPANRFGFDINFAAPYNANGLSANDSFINVVDEVGAFQTGSEALGAAEFLFAEMAFRANTPGVAQFFADPPDLAPFHDILLFEPPAPVPLDRVNLGIASITIVGVGAEGEFTNPVNHLDVSGDGVIAPNDVLLVFNDLSANGARELPGTGVVALGEGESGSVKLPTGFVDTNGDGSVSPIDALQVINFLNTQSLGEGEGRSILVTNSVVDAAQQSAAASIASSLVIDTSRAKSRDPEPSRIEARQAAAPESRAVDTLFYYHSRVESASPARDSRVVDVDSALVSDELLDLLADLDSDAP